MTESFRRHFLYRGPAWSPLLAKTGSETRRPPEPKLKTRKESSYIPTRNTLYITKRGDIDIDLDINDHDLQVAVKNNDAIGITRFIERGLTNSTHIMCLISADTAKSWWVPYELGFAKNAGRYLSTLKLKGDISLPAYLEIAEIIPGTKSLNDYLTRVRRGLGKAADTRTLTETLTAHNVAHPLDSYLNWNK